MTVRQINILTGDETSGEYTTAEKTEHDKVKSAEKTLADNAYKDVRKYAYPDIGDQLDDLYKKGAFSDEMAALIKKVKDDNPK